METRETMPGMCDEDGTVTAEMTLVTRTDEDSPGDSRNGNGASE